MKNNNLLTIILVAIVVGILSFFGGMQYQKTQRPNFPSLNGNQGGQGGRFFGRGQGGNFRPVAGEIVSIDDKSVTVKVRDGSTKIVILSDSTQINKQATGSRDDLKVGTTIAVFGNQNSDGSVTAQNIQLNPIMRMVSNPTPTQTK